MSKNLTRKGLALGAVVALGSSLFAGTPATAAPSSLILDTAFGTSGTSQNGILGEYFHLAASEVGGTTSDPLKFYVEGATAANLTVRTRNVTDLTSNGSTYQTALTATSSTTNTAGVSAVDDAAKIATIIPTDAYAAGNYEQLAIKLATSVDATTTIKVTPFLDSTVADNKPGTGELTGTPVSITFNKASEVTATTTVQSATIGSVVATTVALDKSINVEQFRAVAAGAVAAQTLITVRTFKDGATTDVDSSTSNAALWNTTDKLFEAKTTATAVSGSIYGATTYIGTRASGAATAVTASAGEVASLDTLSFDGNFRHAAFSGASSTTDIIRAGAGSFTAYTTVLTVAAGKLVSGQKVTFKVAEHGANLLNSAATVTAGGKSLTNTSTTTVQSFTVDVVSDANGDVELPISYTGIKNNDQIDVIAYAAPAATGTASIYAGTSAGVTITGQDASAAAIVDEVISANSSAHRAIAKGGTFSATYTVVDQFGKTPAGTYRVEVTNANATTAPAITTPVAVADGKVTVTGTDNSLVADEYDITVTLKKLGTDGTTYEAIATGAVSNSSAPTKIAAGTPATVSALSLSVPVTTAITRAGTSLVAGNSDLDRGTVDHHASTLSGLATRASITATATSATGAVVPGASVTFAAAGVLFVSGNVFGLGSLTVVADNLGVTPAVYAYSNISGKQTVTVTSGSVTKTQALTYAAAVSGGKTWTVTAPASILPGQTLKVSAVLKDKYGAPVNTGAGAIKVVYTGAGYVTSTIADETDADGVVSFSVLLGASDSGTSTVKFTYGGADLIAADTATDDVVTTASIIIGAAPVVAPAVKANVVAKTKAFSVSVSGNASAKNVVVKVAGKTVATLAGSASAKTYTVKATKGSKKVTVYVGGKLIATKTVSVK